MTSRYQHAPWLTRRWRDRHLLRIPFDALRGWWRERTRAVEPCTVAWSPMSFANHWSIACGMCDVRRNYVWSWEECKEMRKEGRRA